MPDNSVLFPRTPIYPFHTVILSAMQVYCIENNDLLCSLDDAGSNLFFKSQLPTEYHCRRANGQMCNNLMCYTFFNVIIDRQYYVYDFINHTWNMTPYDGPLTLATIRGDNACRTAGSTKCANPSCKQSYNKKIMNFLLESGIGNSNVYCYRCYNHRAVKCTLCGQRGRNPQLYGIFPNDHIGMGEYEYYAPNFSPTYLCRVCADTYMRRCQTCGRLTHNSTILDEGCKWCNTDVIHNYNYKPSPIFLDDVNDGEIAHTNLFFGMELEVEMKPEFSGFLQVVSRRFAKDVTNLAYLKKDSSIGCGFEIVSHPGSFEWWTKKDNKLLKSIAKLPKTCESYGVDSTGIHLHMSRVAFTPYHLGKFLYFLNNNKLLTTFIAERYQKTQAGFSWSMGDNAASIAQGGALIDRHTAINLITNQNENFERQQTIEVRVFKGNLRIKRILKNIEYLKAVYDLTQSLFEDGKSARDYGKRNWDQTDITVVADKMSVAEFKAYVKANENTYPNLWEFIKNYKKDN